VSKRTRLEESLISTGFPFRAGDNFKQYLAIMADLMPRAAGLRRPGAAALDLAYVAAGFAEAFFENGLNPWDVAAGSLLVTEAGGLISNFTGEGEYLDQREVLAGAPRIYGQLVPILSKYSKFAGVDAKLAASERIRATDPTRQASSGGGDDVYARSTVELGQPTPDTESSPASSAPAPARKMIRAKRPTDAPAAGGDTAPGTASE
jgi:myo-inositol-1(or 4)-monophosphatase